MLDVSNRVTSNVEFYVKRVHPEVNFQNYDTASPPDLPAMSVVQIDNPEVAVDLGGDPIEDLSVDSIEDFSVDSNIEIQSYSNKSVTEAKRILTTACDAMRRMSYRRTYGITNLPTRNVPNQYRCVARFRRIVSSLDELPKFTQQSGGN